MSRKRWVEYEDETFKVIRFKANGKARPATVVIVACPPDETRPQRSIELKIDELFDLTDILDDLCDRLEDIDLAEKTTHNMRRS